MSAPATGPAKPPGPISISIVCNPPFKSIRELKWDLIPPFAVVTGLNGSGKSQLLELLSYRLCADLAKQHWIPEGVRSAQVTVTGDSFGPHDVVFIPAAGLYSDSISLGFSGIQDAKAQLFDQIQPSNFRGNRSAYALRGRVERVIGRSLEKVTREDFYKELPDNFVHMLDESDVVSGLAYVFLAYRGRYYEALDKSGTKDAALKVVGPPPWEVVNEVLERSGLEYRVVSPMQTSFTDYYQFKIVPADGSDLVLNPGDLSSGERVILQLVLWLYNSQHQNRFPRVLLLDEPDARLHPTMTSMFMDVIKNVLVDRFGVRVIMTTHSPSTVALTPIESLFEMQKAIPRLVKSSAKETAIGQLTAGLVTVSKGTRFVLVEDEDDVDFYSSIRGVLTHHGPGKDPCAIPLAPSFAFLAASRGKGSSKIGGGSSVVTQWVAKLDTPPLNELIRGVIDRDAANVSSGRVYVVGRYSIENYLLDPFVVFGRLVDAGLQAALPCNFISRGNEHLIRGLPKDDLQAIVDAVAGKVAPNLVGLQAAEQSQVPVGFTSGAEVLYPKWLLDRRGHDLLQPFQQTFGGPTVIAHPKMLASFERVRMVPSELATLLRAIQAN